MASGFINSECITVKHSFTSVRTLYTWIFSPKRNFLRFGLIVNEWVYQCPIAVPKIHSNFFEHFKLKGTGFVSCESDSGELRELPIDKNDNLAFQLNIETIIGLGFSLGMDKFIIQTI